MNRFKAALGALLVALLMATGLVSPANAYITGVARVVQASNTTTPLYVDNAMVWRKQDDGTGVYVDWTSISTTNCSRLRSGPKWFDIHVWVYDGNSGALISAKDFSNTDLCNPEFQISRYGNDTGYVRVVFMLAGTRDTGVKFWWEYGWDLYPSGNSVNWLADSVAY